METSLIVLGVLCLISWIVPFQTDKLSKIWKGVMFCAIVGGLVVNILYDLKYINNYNIGYSASMVWGIASIVVIVASIRPYLVAVFRFTSLSLFSRAVTPVLKLLIGFGIGVAIVWYLNENHGTNFAYSYGLVLPALVLVITFNVMTLDLSKE